MTRVKTWMIIAVALLAGPWSVAQYKDVLPYPKVLKGMHTEWVAENIRYNGLPARILNFRYSDPVDDLFARYESTWRFEGFSKVVRRKFNGMDILGIEHSEAYFTVQARDTADGGSEGSLIVSERPLDAQVDLDTSFPLYPNSEIVSIIESMDGGLNAETIISINNSSASSNAGWIESNLRRDGWRSQQFGTPQLHRKTRQLMYQKQQQLAQITIMGNSPEYNGKTAVIVNWMK